MVVSLDPAFLLLLQFQKLVLIDQGHIHASKSQRQHHDPLVCDLPAVQSLNVALFSPFHLDGLNQLIFQDR